MIKGFLAKLISWEGQWKSNWTKATEAEGLTHEERKKLVDKAREDLGQEQERLKRSQESRKEESKKVA
jgi:hypothetical protein